MRNIFKFIFVLTIVMLTSCGSDSIIIQDYYRIYPPDEYSDGYYIMCKLACADDPKIENIIIVKWNSKNIFIKQKDKNGKFTWYRIKAKSKTLTCCNNDILTGPFNEFQVNNLIKNERIKNLEMRSFY
ncbi:hypothetical protein [Salmonirosea aquatica]|uniref:Lipoprotein n=1 Tax=Salmonirosea aquatica TaxID=2654236 RepID=A0A7C9F4C1_9BACT|nr:hypothetical protein [Cytophagaceae bacterium SJW1-29]